MPYRVLGKVKPMGRFLDVLVHITMKPTEECWENPQIVNLLDKAIRGQEEKGFHVGYCKCEVVGDSHRTLEDVYKDTTDDPFDPGLLELLGIAPGQVEGDLVIGNTIYGNFFGKHNCDKWRGLAALWFGKEPEHVTTKERFIMLLFGKLI